MQTDLGMLYFALVAPGTTFDPGVHNREDLSVYDLTITQEEGSYAVAKLEIDNPGFGLLNQNFPRRIFISIQQGPDVKLLFSGRISGFPLSVDGNVISIEYLAQPEDWETKEQALIDQLKQRPAFNPLFFDSVEAERLSDVLEGFSVLPFWRRDTGELLPSDILEGRQALTLDQNIVFFEGPRDIDMRIGDTPVKRVNMEIDVEWLQRAKGQVDVGLAVEQEFGNPWSDRPRVNTLTPDSFERAWDNANIPAGYSLLKKELSRLSPDRTLTKDQSLFARRFGRFDEIGGDVPLSEPENAILTNIESTGPAIGERRFTFIRLNRAWYEAEFKLSADFQQKRQETLTFTIDADLQDILLGGEFREEDASLKIEDPTSESQGQLLDQRRSSFHLGRDLQSVSELGESSLLFALGKAQSIIRKSSRAVEITVETLITDDVLDITTDHSVFLDLPELLPGGQGFGKVLSYDLNFNSDQGQWAEITTAFSVGTGNGPNVIQADALLKEDGDLFLKEDGFRILLDEAFSSERDVYTNIDGTSIESSVTYDLQPPSIDEPVDAFAVENDPTELVQDITVENDGETQAGKLQGSGFGFDPRNFREDNPTSLRIKLASLRSLNRLQADIGVGVSDLPLPKQIDLASDQDVSLQGTSITTESGESLITQDGRTIEL